MLIYLLFLFVVYAIKKNKYNLETLITWFIPLIGGAFCFNLHLLTGKNAEHGHYLNRIIIPFLSLLMIIFISNSLKKQRKIANSMLFNRLLLLFYFMMICQAFNKQYGVSIKTISYHHLKNPDHDILHWVNNNIKKVSVIGTSNEQFILMMPLTKHWNFVGNAYRTHASDKELLTRYAIICKILNFSLEQTLQSVSSKVTLQNRESIINAGIDKKELKYLEQQMATIDVKKEITTRHLDYILYPATWSLDKMLPITGVTYRLIYSNSRWAICKLDRN